MSKIGKIIIWSLFGFMTWSNPAEDLWRATEGLYQDRKEYVEKKFPNDQFMIDTIYSVENMFGQEAFQTKTTDEEKIELLCDRLGLIISMYGEAYEDDSSRVDKAALDWLDATNPEMREFIDKKRNEIQKVAARTRRSIEDPSKGKEKILQVLALANQRNMGEAFMRRLEELRRPESTSPEQDRFNEQYSETRSYVRRIEREVEKIVFAITEVVYAFEKMKDYPQELRIFTEEDMRQIDETYNHLLQAKSDSESMYADIPERGNRIGHTSFAEGLDRFKKQLQGLPAKYNSKIGEELREYIKQIIFVIEFAEQFSPIDYPSNAKIIELAPAFVAITNLIRGLGILSKEDIKEIDETTVRLEETIMNQQNSTNELRRLRTTLRNIRNKCGAKIEAPLLEEVDRLMAQCPSNTAILLRE